MLNKKSQGASEVFKYLIIAVISVVILAGGYKAINLINSRSCQADLASFEMDLKGMGKNLRYGEKELKTFSVPCNVEKVYLLDLKKGVDPGAFDNIAIIRDSLQSRTGKNIFLAAGNNVKHSFSAGPLEIESPGYLCLKPHSGQLSFFIESVGGAARITLPPEQLQCS